MSLELRALREEVDVLRAELSEARVAIASLQERLSSLESRTPGAGGDTPSEDSGFILASAVEEPAGYRVGTERESAAREIGQWVRRALAGQRHGLSGRQRITLSSRLYLVFKDFDLQEYNPPLVFWKWSDCRELVTRGGQPGDSIFVGLPSKTEARLVCSAASLRVPESLTHGHA